MFPGFLHNLFGWIARQSEGTAKGTATEAEIEANPIVQIAVSAAEVAAQTVLLNHVGTALGVPPTAEGVAGAVGGIIDGTTVVPTTAKEPLKILLGGLLSGSNFLASAEGAASSFITGGSAQNPPLSGTLGSAEVAGSEGITT